MAFTSRGCLTEAMDLDCVTPIKEWSVAQGNRYVLSHLLASNCDQVHSCEL